MAFIEGYGIGLGMIIFIGPVFFLLLNSSLQYGHSAGLAVATGIIVSDILCVVLCYYSLSEIIINEENKMIIGGIGSLLIFLVGISYLFKKSKKHQDDSIRPLSTISFFLKGFSINFFNPFVFVVWIGVYNYGQHQFVERGSLLVFLGSVLTGILTTDVLKVFLSGRVKKLITPDRLEILFKITGVILILFSLRWAYEVL